MTTFVSGYWDLTNDNHKNYIDSINKIINKFDKNYLIFFYDNDETLSLISNKSKNNIIYKKLSIDSLETSWTSKIFLINDVIKENFFNTNFFAWINISLLLDNNKLYHQFYLPNSLYYFKNKEIIDSKFLIADKKTWNIILPLYKHKLLGLNDSNNIHTEETILNLIYKDNKDLFYNINDYKPDNRNISLKYGACFIHIPKCGGTTVEKLIFNDNNGRNGTLPLSDHSTIESFKNFYYFYIFTYVRNPYTRVISVFNYYMQNGNGTRKDRKVFLNKKNKSLDTFLDHFNSKNLSHLNTQTYYLKNCDNIDYIARFENYTEELKFILKKLNCNVKNIIHCRKKEKKNYLITPKFINQVNSIYLEDFKNFNYNIISINEPIFYNDFIKKYI